MILLDAPYVSDFLKQTIKNLDQPVLDTPTARRLAGDAGLKFIDEIEFSARLGLGQRLLSNSENALAHTMHCGCNENLIRQINICKDKALFRETIASVHPEYRFLRVKVEHLDEVEISTISCPFVIKPARGFFSLGVHVVNNHAEWPKVVQAIREERAVMNAEYPEEVVNAGEYIIEENIAGEEYAIDVSYEEDGTPIILNILHHHFVSEEDVSDRLYYTSTGIIRDWLEPFQEYVTKVGNACDFRNFPIHLEIRADGDGRINAIEANPLRFAGWGVADITYHAWGFNPYEYFFKGLRPDWDALMEGRDDMVSVMVIADVPPGMNRETIAAFDYEAFAAMFDKVLELREIDFTEYPVFGFVFAETDEAGLAVLKEELKEDFSRFITTR